MKSDSTQRYSITSPLPAIRLIQSHEKEKAGVMTLFPAKAIVETRGRSKLGAGMVEITWHCQRYAVFQRHLAARATLVRIKAVGN